MIPLVRLKRAVQDGLDYLRTVPDLREAEVYASANANLIARLNYTSHIPSNGVEEPKSTESYGIGVHAVFESKKGLRVGFGSEPTSLDHDGVLRALEKARAGAVSDPDFVCLARPTGERRTLRDYHDPALLRLQDTSLVEAGWRVLERALETFSTSEQLAIAAGGRDKVAKTGLVLGGDVSILQERMAIASFSMPQPQADESTLIMSFVTGMVEREGAKGTGWSTGMRLAEFDGSAGVEAARGAIEAMNGVRVPTGEYRVIFGRQAVADLLNHILLPCLTLDTVYARASAFNGKLGQRIASEMLTLVDDGAAPGLMGSKGITDEGLPTGRTVLIKDGVLAGLLSNWYETQRILRDPEGKAKLGADPAARQGAFVPRNGFRFVFGGGRHFVSPAGTYPTNVLLETPETLTTQDLLRRVGDGLYIGRIWYTYPINGLAAGDFTCTVVGDSYVIKNGRLSSPIQANVLRIDDSIHNVLNNILGIGGEARGTLVWAADEVVYAPEVAVGGVHVREIAHSLAEG